MADIIQLNEKESKSQLGDMVRQSVEDTLNTMLDEEADLYICVIFTVHQAKSSDSTKN